MRRFLFILNMCMVLLGNLNAQNSVVGSVYKEDGNTISGVLILQKGTHNGTITNENGYYKIVAPSDATLVFSLIGMETREEKVNGRSLIDIHMGNSSSCSNDFAVTALGIKRRTETLHFMQQSVSGNELVKSKDINFLNSLSGKLAGVYVKKSSSGAGGSSRLVLRGSKSLMGDCEPLYVIDGIPFVNNKGNQPGMWGGIDQGDGLSQINPEDIESITVLNGLNASVLYGGKGANGVVLLTTKNGKKGRTRIKIGSGITFENIQNLPKFQYRYGTKKGETQSWSSTSGNYDDTFIEDYFETGVNFLNTVSISGGNDKTTAYFSYANTTANGITPNNKYRKNNVSFKQSTKLFNGNLLVSSTLLLANEVSQNRNPSGYYLNPLTGLYMFPRNGIEGKGMDYYKLNYEFLREDRNIMWQNWFVLDHLQSNPYWIRYKEPNENKTQHVIGNLSLDWKLSERFYMSVRGSYDYTDKILEIKHFAGTNTANAHPNGRWDFQKYTDDLIFSDALLRYHDYYSTISINATLGVSYQRMVYGSGVLVNTGINGLVYPNEFFFQNLPTNVQVHSTLDTERKEKAAFGTVALGFSKKVIVDFSARNDWVSNQIANKSHSYFYPALGLTTILSEFFDMPEWLSFAKMRTSFAQGINTAALYSTDYLPIISGSPVNNNQTRPQIDLEPEKLKSIEIGTDWRLLNERLGVGFTYYTVKSEGKKIFVPIPSGNQYFNLSVESVEIINKGIELTIDAIPLRKEKFIWKTALNYSTNKNSIEELRSNLNWIDLGSSEGYSTRIQENGSVGDLYVYKFKRNNRGKILFDNAGIPLKTPNREFVGNLDPNWSLGWKNTITYARFDLSFIVNARIGGKVFSQTESMLDGAGVSQRSGDARDVGYVVVYGVVESTGATISRVDPELWYSTIGDRNGIGESYVYDRTNVRLGQFSLSYNFNFSKIKFPVEALTCSLVGQNLFFLYLDAPFDPELVMSTNRSSQSLDNFNLPSTRTIGFKVKFTF